MAHPPVVVVEVAGGVPRTQVVLGNAPAATVGTSGPPITLAPDSPPIMLFDAAGDLLQSPDVDDLASRALNQSPSSPNTSWTDVSATHAAFPGTFFGVLTDAASVISQGADWHLLRSPATSALTSGTTYAWTAIVKEGTSGGVSIQFINVTTTFGSAIAGDFGSVVTAYEFGGTFADTTEAALPNGWVKFTGTFTPNGSNTYYIGVGPNSATVGHTVVVAAAWVEVI